MADVRSLFDNLELRVFIIISTLLQICLIVWTYQRKRSSSQPVRRIMWLAAYMAADFAATLSLGAIFHANINPNASQDGAKQKYLLTLWSPFILLHLGSHSKMTAFSLADNEFWLSHILRFIYHEVTALVICILGFLASTERPFGYLSIILFIIGTLKFVERILALKRGSMKKLRSSTFKEVDPGLKVQDMVRISSKQLRANRQGQVELQLGPHNAIDVGDDSASQLVACSTKEDVKTLCAAYQSFNKYKGLYVDAIFMYRGKDDKGKRFADMNADDAFKIMEMELSFAHDLFYTKTALTHTIWGWFVRILSLNSISIATVLFVHINKHGFQQPDVWITYGLLIAAFIFEVLSFLESLTSNQTIIQVGFLEGYNWRRVEAIIRRFHSFIKIIKGIMRPKPNSIGQFSVLRYCYSDSKSSIWFKRLLDFLELKELWDEYHYTTYVSSDDDSHHQCKDRIFQEVRRRLAEERSQGDYNIFHTLVSDSVKSKLERAELQANIQKEVEECILIWHFATHLCFETVDEPRPVPLQDAKFISDYMLYLLTVDPSTVSSVATTELTSYRKACAASLQLYMDYKEQLRNGTGAEVYWQLEQIDNITQQEPREGPIFLLLDGYQVAHKLMVLGRQQSENRDNNIWELLFQVWVDVLSYAAKYSKGKCHAEQLGTGGQFLTYVWLFMVHLILDSRYQIEVDQNRDGQ
ncbi:hypothetical protein RHSIM_Rhsim10G0179700 [Rhododendron simsii]|uniref:DUF4220 domain-containing protein n=1 Tax=Rhododendron simsii TaxID=118357 RepID=A0A834LAM0_RHOSS|nr:hypothetical protein RHSIM_Rhsim10G0179700 [Rhododendron simsii]